jgi:hypothetical protein
MIVSHYQSRHATFLRSELLECLRKSWSIQTHNVSPDPLKCCWACDDVGPLSSRASQKSYFKLRLLYDGLIYIVALTGMYSRSFGRWFPANLFSYSREHHEHFLVSRHRSFDPIIWVSFLLFKAIAVDLTLWAVVYRLDMPLHGS